jgi:hypothetical protein
MPDASLTYSMIAMTKKTDGEEFIDEPLLRIGRFDSVSWAGQPQGSRGIPSEVRVLTPGCYGFQIDGTNFSRTVVVTVDTAH